MSFQPLLLPLLLPLFCCTACLCRLDRGESGEQTSPGTETDADTNSVIDSDADTDADTDSDTDSDADADADSDSDSDTDADADTDLHCDEALLEMIHVSAGSFIMGCSESEVGCNESYEQAHNVELTKSFCIGVTEVTQDEFERYASYNPAHDQNCGGSCPVEQLTWHEAAWFCNLLSTQAGLPVCYDCSGKAPEVTCTAPEMPYTCGGYRLPTEAEWEYAARAGEEAALHNGGNLVDGTETSCEDGLELDDKSLLGDLAWYCGSSYDSAHAVAGRNPNNWGLHDMSGNVWEWCNDGYANDTYAGDVIDPVGAKGDIDQRARRGGSFTSAPYRVRSAVRYGLSQDTSWSEAGFRVVIASGD